MTRLDPLCLFVFGQKASEEESGDDDEEDLDPEQLTVKQLKEELTNRGLSTGLPLAAALLHVCCRRCYLLSSILVHLHGVFVCAGVIVCRCVAVSRLAQAGMGF